MQRESKKANLYVELFNRHPQNPILTAQDWPYPANTVFNAGACQMGDETILLVRVEDRRGHSHLSVARSKDGINYEPIVEWTYDLSLWRHLGIGGGREAVKQLPTRTRLP